MSNTDSSIRQYSSETVVDLGRTNSFSDCIFAFAVTLLVLDIRIPDATLAGSADKAR